MRARRALAAAALSCALAVALAGTAWAEGFTISIVSPTEGTLLYGPATVDVSVAAGQESPTSAAFEVSSDGAWTEGRSVALAPGGSGYTGSFDSTWVPNGTYTLIARAWGGEYDAADASSYAQSTTTVKINNAPPTPSGLSASGSNGSVSISWTAVGSHDRSDFAGYTVYRAAAAGSSCPGFGDYDSRGTVQTNSYSEGGVSRNYCYSVVANRTSPQSGTISSDASTPVVAGAAGQVDGGNDDGGNGGGGNGGGGGGDVSYVKYGSSGRGGAPPLLQAPHVREVIPDGPFEENLPYERVSVSEFDRLVSEGSGIGTGLTSSTDPRQKAMTLVAAGLLLGVSAMHIRRFVSVD